MTTPPPSPVREPRKPATTATLNNRPVNSRGPKCKSKDNGSRMPCAVTQASWPAGASPKRLEPRMSESGQITSRLVLVVGFGGLLLLMGYAGLDGIQALEQIRTSN